MDVFKNFNGFSHKVFWPLFLLTLFSPLLGNLDLILFGARLDGRIVTANFHQQGSLYTIDYVVDSKVYELTYLDDFPYRYGEDISILYNKEDPSDAVIYSVNGVFLQSNGVVAIVLMLFEIAFYAYYLQEQARRRNNRKIATKNHKEIGSRTFNKN